MEKELKQNLVAKLYNNLKLAKIKADMQTNSEKNEKSAMFTSPKGIRINSKYLSNKEYFQIVEFYEFLKENPDLTDDEIREILNSNNKFSFLRKVDQAVPNMFEELRDHGVMYIAVSYVSNKHGDKLLNL